MKRILDGGTYAAAPPDGGLTSEDAAQLRDLFRDVEPTGDLDAAEARVRDRLSADPRAATSAWSSATLVGVLVGAGVVAALLWAEVGRRAVAPTKAPVPAQATPAASVVRPPSSEGIAPVQGNLRGAPAPARAMEPPRAPARRLAEPSAKRSSSSERSSSERSLPGRAPQDPAVAVERCELEPLDTAMVVDAVGALRRDDDPRRALLLIDYYLAHKPGGALVEEAMAIGIEAAVRRGDASVRSRARRYLDRFPEGRYAGYARTAVQPAGHSLRGAKPETK